MTPHRYTTETGASMHQMESLPSGSDSCLPTNRRPPRRWMTAMKCTSRAGDCPPAVSKVSETIAALKRSWKTNKKVDKGRLIFLYRKLQLGYVTLSTLARLKKQKCWCECSPASPRCRCFDSVIIKRRHDTDPAAASVWEEKLEHRLDFPAPAPSPADWRPGRPMARPVDPRCDVTGWCVSCSSLTSAAYWCMYVLQQGVWFTVAHEPITSVA